MDILHPRTPQEAEKALHTYGWLVPILSGVAFVLADLLTGSDPGQRDQIVLLLILTVVPASIFTATALLLRGLRTAPS